MNEITNRKDEHIEINLGRDVRSSITTGFEQYAFVHEALPEIGLAHVSTETQFLGKTVKIPLLISSMTGGSAKGELINLRLAEAANSCGIAMGVGSQRADIENWTVGKRSSIRDVAPNIPLYANLGAVQLNYGFTVDECLKAVDMIEADALILHLNSLQEALQPEGQTDFRGLSKKIETVCKRINVQVIVKEVGWGISVSTAKRLVELGVSAIDVAGAGGTSWSEVERHRSTTDSQVRIASLFRDWGIPTAESLKDIHTALPNIPLIASGGISNGVEIAKAIALGAHQAGIARPFLVAANESTEAVIDKIGEIQKELSITMFSLGAATINEMQSKRLLKRNN
jgi:isopentenyl-diphosphate delta-isomerase